MEPQPGKESTSEEGCQCNLEENTTEQCLCDEESVAGVKCLCGEENVAEDKCLRDEEEPETFRGCHCDLYDRVASAQGFRIHDCLGENRTVTTEQCLCDEESVAGIKCLCGEENVAEDKCLCDEEEPETFRGCHCDLYDRVASAQGFRIHDCLGENRTVTTEQCLCDEESVAGVKCLCGEENVAEDKCLCDEEEPETFRGCHCDLYDRVASAQGFRIHDCLGENRTVSAAGYRVTPRFLPRRSHVIVVYRNGQDLSDKMIKIHSISTSVKILKQVVGRLIATEAKNIILIKNDIILKDNYPVGDVKSTHMNYVEIIVKTKDDTKFSLKDIPKDKYIDELIISDVCTKKIVDYILVKFRIRYQGDSFVSSYPPNTTVKELRDILGKTFGVDPDNLDILRNGLIAPDARQLVCMDYDDFGNLELEIVTKDCSHLNMDRFYNPEDIVTDILTVCLDADNGQKPVELNVEIIDKRFRKPYLGGYRNTKTGVEYHHAFSQSAPKVDKAKYDVTKRSSRITQTQPETEKTYNTSQTTATQMPKHDLYIACQFDYVILPGLYESYDDMVRRLRREHYASIIQRAYRAYRYRILMKEWLQRCKERAAKIRREKEEEKEELARRVNMDVTTKTLPRTKEDFDQLYAMVDRWKFAEHARITRLHNKAAQIAEMSLLLDREVELLRAIDTYKVELQDDIKKIKDQKFLQEISKPVVWENKNGRMVAMDTIESQTARKLKDLYNEFCKKVTNIEDRIALLVDMKNALQGFLHPLTEQIISLLERECELLVRSCTDNDLEYLRERIRLSIMQFIKSSDINGGIVRRKNKLDFKKMENFSTYVCKMCNKLKHWTAFCINNKMKEITICNKCANYNMTSRPWPDTTSYKHLLRSIQREERRNKCWGSLAFVLQVSDIYYIVDKIWHSKSAISECEDMYLLRLCKWNINEDWSPWNCFLVTREEMRAHEKLKDPERVYDEEFVIDVKNKHATARQQFHQLLVIENRLVGKGRWHKVKASPADWSKGMEAL